MKPVKAIQFERVDQVASWRLCMGCGACQGVCPNRAIALVNIPEQGIRPRIDPAKCRTCGACVEVCPGIRLTHHVEIEEGIELLRPEWGPVLEVWEGFASDPEIRYRGSSGGLSTALGLFALEKRGAAGVYHIGSNPRNPIENIEAISRNRQDLIDRSGSRYSPAAPCVHFRHMNQHADNSVFIGKPCDIEALRKYQNQNKTDSGGVLAISIFCAATPSTRGTLELLRERGIDPGQVKEIRYRGCGWPGQTSVRILENTELNPIMSYEDSWGRLTRYGQFRCRLCPDSTGEFADLSCGDPWYREIEPNDPGHSLVLVRTEKGREFLQHAMREGYVQLQPADPKTLIQSQVSLLGKRRSLYGRLWAMKVFRIPCPCYEGFSLVDSWRRLSFLERIYSVLGTWKRIVIRKLYRPERIVPEDGDCKVIPGRNSNGNTKNL